ncbi:MAG: DUF1522 domain-containing protein, partial [Alcaligenaceae bacterium]
MKLVSRLRLLVPLSITCAAMLLGVSAVAQDSVWKCGNVLTDGAGNSTIYLGTAGTTATVGDLENAIDLASGVQSASITSAG